MKLIKMKLKDKKSQELLQKLGECEVITFDKKKIWGKILKSYKMKEQAHALLLQADVLLDEVLNELYGEKINTRRN